MTAVSEGGGRERDVLKRVIPFRTFRKKWEPKNEGKSEKKNPKAET